MSTFSYMYGEPSDWVIEHAGLVPEGSPVLDVAAGAGRHTGLFLDRGHPVTAVDRDPSRLRARPGLTIVRADIEEGPWPLAGQLFGGVVVTNYLHRPLLPMILAAVAPGGVLLYETFTVGTPTGPSNPDFLLQPGELREVVAAELRVVAHQEGRRIGSRPTDVQAVAAVRPRG